MARRITYASYARALGLPADSTAAIARSMARNARRGATSSNMRVLSPRRSNSGVRNTARYSGITREQQQRRNQTASARRMNNYFRTAADSGRGQSYAKAQPTNAQARSQSYRNVRAAFGLSVS